MTKTYEAPNSILSNLTLIHNGKVYKISFQPVSAFAASQTGHGSIFITSDKELMEAIESSRLFHRSIFIFKTEGDEVAEEPEEEQREYKVVTVDSPTDARDYLVENFGIDKKRVLNLKQIKTAAQKVGILFEGI